MAEQATSGSAGRLAIRNIGLILSGRLEQPILDGDCILCEGDRIAAVGYEKDIDLEGVETVVDARGTTVAPGLMLP